MANPAAPALSVATTRQDRSTAAIAQAATRTGVDFTYLYHQARIESALNPDAKARTSSATGLYQFINQSWLGVVDKHGDEHGLGWAANAIERGSNGRYHVRDPQLRQAILDLRKNPEAAALMAGEFAADNRAYLETRTSGAIAPVDLYLAHFLGPAGAAKFLNARDAAPAQSGAALFPDAARANRSIFYGKNGAPRSLDAIRNLFAAKLGAGSAAPLSGPTGGATAGDATFSPVEDTTAFRHVQPRDYIRIAGHMGADSAAAYPAGQPATGAIISPAQARLAYLMFAAMGLNSGLSA